MSEETTGVEYVLFATEEERRAIIFVELYFCMVEILALQNGASEVTIYYRNLHWEFPRFIESLNISHNPLEKTLFSKIGEECPAVKSYNRAHQTREGILVAKTFHLKPHFNFERKKDQARDLARRLDLHCHPQYLSDRVAESLRRMGIYPTREAPQPF